MTEGTDVSMTLLDWRRRVAALYAEVRATSEQDPAGTAARFRAGRDRLFREASLQAGAADHAFLLNRYVAPRIAQLFLPLDGPDGVLDGLALDDIPEGMRAPFTFGGRL